MAWAVLTPKHAGWFRLSASVAAASLLAFALWAWWTPWSPGRFGGLAFGTAAATIFYVDALYPLRRRLLAWPLKTAKQWLQLHIYLGVLGCLFVGIHVGFHFPNGQFGWWLLVLTLWSTAAGLFGVYLQKHVPDVLAHHLSVEAIYERIPELSSRLQREADELIAGSPEVLRRFYVTHVRPELGHLSPAWAYVVGFRPQLNRRVEVFRDVAAFLSPDDRIKLSGLETILSEKLELDVHYSLQRLLRQWVAVHVVPAIVLVALLTVHIAAVLIF